MNTSAVATKSKGKRGGKAVRAKGQKRVKEILNAARDILIEDGYTQFSLPTAGIGLIALAAATLFYVVAVLCQFEALARLPAATAAFILNLEPVVSIVLAAIILHDNLVTLQWIGVALVVSVLFAAIRFTAVTSTTSR